MSRKKNSSTTKTQSASAKASADKGAQGSKVSRKSAPTSAKASVGKTRKASEATTMQQKHEHAKLLYTVQGVTVQKELAERVGVSAQTINKWVNADDRLWDRMRESVLITKEAEIRRLYMQLTELNDKIMSRDKGERFANSKEGDILSKLSKSIKEMETETSLAEVMEVLKNFLVFVRQQDVELSKTITAIADQFIKSHIK
jgi:transcriptional regulator with XRE-family HTH domain